jgi:hypothetical protein
MFNWSGINRFSENLFKTTFVSVGREAALEIASGPETRPHWDNRHENNPGPWKPYDAPEIDMTDLHLLGWKAK